jgi:hypothetical protein
MSCINNNQINVCNIQPFSTSFIKFEQPPRNTRCEEKDNSAKETKTNEHKKEHRRNTG